ncbi:hypothetical protein AB6A40_001237 [Gnathostoma spinigerum]|uniref:Uncharacterized protein n=1 Tax=Gnathostoma spinigerum TaxID=75299 RepID=A0ABD6E3P5_9BILA
MFQRKHQEEKLEYRLRCVVKWWERAGGCTAINELNNVLLMLEEDRRKVEKNEQQTKNLIEILRKAIEGREKFIDEKSKEVAIKQKEAEKVANQILQKENQLFREHQAEMKNRENSECMLM